MSLDLIQKIGVSPAVLQQLGTLGVEPKLVGQSLKMVKDGEVVLNLPLSAQAVEGLTGGNMSPLIKQALKDSLVEVVSTLTATSDSPLHAKIGQTPKLKPTGTVIGPIKKEGAKPDDAMGGVFDLKAMELAQTVQLRDATLLYQPVKGTGGGSRYFCVACSEGLNMAARFKDGKLSLRFEGDALGANALLLKSLGLTVSEQHASVHLNVSSLTQANKAIGALLVAADRNWTTPLPKASLISGKGQ